MSLIRLVIDFFISRILPILIISCQFAYSQSNSKTSKQIVNSGSKPLACDNWLYLPSSPSFVQIGNLNVTGDQLTVEAVVNMTQPFLGSPTIGSDIVGKYSSPPDVNYLLRAQNAQITTTVQFYKTPNACDLELNKTYHLAMVYDGTSLKYYRNGFLMSQVPASGNLIQNNWITEIGFYQPAIYNTNFMGYINEVRIWNVARTQAQIQTYMNTSLPLPASQTGLLAYYTFDDLTNKQGNPAWNGSLSGAASIAQTNPNCSFTADNDCCAALSGTFSGNEICKGQPGFLTFHLTSSVSNPPYTLSYSDQVNTYIQLNVQDGVPFQVPSNPVAATNYPLLRITDAAMCTTVVQNQAATIDIFPDGHLSTTSDTSICKGDRVQLNVSGGSNYVWSPASLLDNPNVANPMAAIDLPTRFYVYGSDNNNCTVVDSVDVNFIPFPTFNTPLNQSVCQGLSVVIPGNNSPDDIYAWTPASGLDNPSSPAPLATPDQTTTYHLHISDAVCSQYNADYDVQVLVNPAPNLILTKSNDIDCSNLTAQLTASGANQYSWVPGENLSDPDIYNPVASLAKTTEFVVKGTASNGCYAYDSITVEVSKTGEAAYSVPNAFTPNNDNLNDCFGLRKWGNINLQEFSIYNRWGQLVFHSTNPSVCWDGTRNGEPQPAGGYVYVIKASTLCGIISRKGTVLLIR